jgi:hypothetical protein
MEAGRVSVLGIALVAATRRRSFSRVSPLRLPYLGADD